MMPSPKASRRLPRLAREYKYNRKLPVPTPDKQC
jgi:ribosomal protein L39E